MNGIGKLSRAMAIIHKDRSMKVAWDVETHLAVVRLSMKHKRGAMGLPMLQMREILVLKKDVSKEQTED